MMRAGLIAQATCTDISPGMLATLDANAQRLGLKVKTVSADAERLPFKDESFDLVLGHAVLHHIPDLPTAFGELARVLAPGGTLLFAGEPSRAGDRLARVPKRFAGTIAPLWRAALRARPAGWADNGSGARPTRRWRASSTCTRSSPANCASSPAAPAWSKCASAARSCWPTGLAGPTARLEATAEPDDVPWAWRQYAYRGYLVLQELDRRLLEPRLPAAIFYNLMLSARKMG